MTTPPAPRDAGSAALTLAERWAECTKAFAIYPPTNVRVRAALDAFQAALGPATAEAGGPVEILFHTEAVHAGGKTVDLPEGSTLHWLHDRIHAAALAGVAFHAGLDEQVLLAFTQHLLGLYSGRARDADFRELWAEPFPGIDPVERRFAGAFEAEGVGGGGRARSWGGHAAGAAPRYTAAPSAEHDVVTRLADEPAITGRLARLQEHLHRLKADDEETRDADILQELVSKVPRDAVRNYDALVELITSHLTALETRFEGGAGPALSERTQRMSEASRGLLGHRGVTVRDLVDREIAQKDLRGHAGDEEVSDDPEALILAMSELPPPSREPLTDQNLSRPAEIVGAYLHCLGRLEDPAVLSRIQKVLVAHLDGADPGTRAVVRQHLEASCLRADGEDPTAPRLLQVLTEAGEGELLRDFGLLDLEVALARFPQYFSLWLDALDPDAPDDADQLVEACRRLGPERFAETRTELLATGLLQGDRVARLLRVRHPALAPLVRLVIEDGRPGDRAAVVTWLTEVVGSQRDAAPLTILRSPAGLPTDYLLRLLPHEGDGEDHERRRLAAELMANWIRETRGLAEETERRAHALRRLVSVDPVLARTVGQEVLARKVLGFLPGEPRQLREVARSVLSGYGA